MIDSLWMNLRDALCIYYGCRRHINLANEFINIEDGLCIMNVIDTLIYLMKFIEWMDSLMGRTLV